MHPSPLACLLRIAIMSRLSDQVGMKGVGRQAAGKQADILPAVFFFFLYTAHFSTHPLSDMRPPISVVSSGMNEHGNIFASLPAQSSWSSPLPTCSSRFCCVLRGSRKISQLGSYFSVCMCVRWAMTTCFFASTAAAAPFVMTKPARLCKEYAGCLCVCVCV